MHSLFCQKQRRSDDQPTPKPTRDFQAVAAMPGGVGPKLVGFLANADPAAKKRLGRTTVAKGEEDSPNGRLCSVVFSFPLITKGIDTDVILGSRGMLLFRLIFENNFYTSPLKHLFQDCALFEVVLDLMVSFYLVVLAS